VTSADDTAGSDLNEAILMSWFPVVKLRNAVRTQASASDITSCFHNEKETLFRLAFLITGDEAQGEASVINAYELTLQGKTPLGSDNVQVRIDAGMIPDTCFVEGPSCRANRGVLLLDYMVQYADGSEVVPPPAGKP
jgi:hypothetical protein